MKLFNFLTQDGEGGLENPSVLTPLIISQIDDKKCAEPLAQDVLSSMIFTPQGDKNPNTFNNFNGIYDSSILFVRKVCAVPADTFSKAIHTTFPRV